MSEETRNKILQQLEEFVARHDQTKLASHNIVSCVDPATGVFQKAIVWFSKATDPTTMLQIETDQDGNIANDANPLMVNEEVELSNQEVDQGPNQEKGQEVSIEGTPDETEEEMQEETDDSTDPIDQITKLNELINTLVETQNDLKTMYEDLKTMLGEMKSMMTTQTNTVKNKSIGQPLFSNQTNSFFI
jgi:hypothetical protein